MVLFSALPASALNEGLDDEDEDDDEISGDERDDEKTGTRYNVCHAFPHLLSDH